MSIAVTNSQPSLKRHVGTWPEQRETRGVFDFSGGTSRKMNVLAFCCVILEPVKLYTKMFSLWTGHEETDRKCQSNGLAKGELFINQQAFWSAQVNISIILNDISHASNIQKRWTNMRSLFESIETICFLFKRESATVNLTRFKHVESQDPPWHLKACMFPEIDVIIMRVVHQFQRLHTQNVLKARSSEHQIPPHPLLICQFSRIHQSVHLQVPFDRNVYIILQYNTGPIPSMYSIFTCVWLIFITHVGKYTMTMDGIYIYGKMASQCIWLSHLPQQKSQASEVPKPTSKISGCVSQLGNLGATHNNTWQHGGTMDRNLGQILEDMENNWSPDILVGGCGVMLKFLMETNALRTK